jgi:CubicO group peptidase (beta-lactamase class C family)
VQARHFPGCSLTASIDTVNELVELAVSERWCTGGQIAASCHGTVIANQAWGVDGLGHPIDVTSLFSVYCAGKPALTTVVARLVGARELSLDDCIGDLLGDATDAVGHITVADILGHQAGLWHVASSHVLGQTSDARKRSVLSLTPQPQPPDVAQYAEFGGWELLRYAIEATCDDTPIHVLFDELVTEPLRIGGDLTFHIDNPVRLQQRLRVNTNTTAAGEFPLRWEHAPSRLAIADTATGCVGTMSALCRLYGAWLEAIDETDATFLAADVASQFVTPTGPTHWDPVLNRDSRYSRGFLVDLGVHNYTAKHSHQSFGYTGLDGRTFAAGDPASGLAYAIHMTSWPVAAVTDPQIVTRLTRRRQLIGDTIIEMLSPSQP